MNSLKRVVVNPSLSAKPSAYWAYRGRRTYEVTLINEAGALEVHYALACAKRGCVKRVESFLAAHRPTVEVYSIDEVDEFGRPATTEVDEKSSRGAARLAAGLAWMAAAEQQAAASERRRARPALRLIQGGRSDPS